MSRDTYDVAEPGTPHDAATDPPPDQPACPHCGGGPLIPTPLGIVCKSCARILTRRARPCHAETFHTGTGLLGRCTLPFGHDGDHAVGGTW